MVSLKILKMNFLRLRKGFVFEKQVFREFHQFSNLPVYRCMPLISFHKSKKTLSYQYSSNTSPASEKNFTNTGLVVDNIVEEIESEEFEEYKELMEEKELTPVDLFEEIAGGNSDLLKKLKILEFEIAVLKETGNKIPSKISKKDWLELLTLSSLSARKQYLSFLRTNELISLSRIAKGKLLVQQNLKKKLEAGFHYYGLGGHTMFHRIYPKSLNQLLSLRQKSAAQSIILDCSYQKYMNKINTRNCAKQICMSLSVARTHQYPCKIELYNFDCNDYLGKIFPNYVANAEENFGVDLYEESFLDKYPKEKLIYLSPHAPCELTEFKKDCIYIIGAFVDKGTGAKASFAKAKENSIKMARLPLDYYLSWKSGTKNFPLNTVTNILLDMHFYNDWTKALRHVPARSVNDPTSRRKWKISQLQDSYFY